MVTTDIFLNLYLTQVKRAHRILRFLYGPRKQKEVLMSIKNLSMASSNSMGLDSKIPHSTTPNTKQQKINIDFFEKKISILHIK